jgi:hypothetical protein
MTFLTSEHCAGILLPDAGYGSEVIGMNRQMGITRSRNINRKLDVTEVKPFSSIGATSKNDVRIHYRQFWE